MARFNFDLLKIGLRYGHAFVLMSIAFFYFLFIKPESIGLDFLFGVVLPVFVLIGTFLFILEAFFDGVDKAFRFKNFEQILIVFSFFMLILAFGFQIVIVLSFLNIELLPLESSITAIGILSLSGILASMV